jgi:hypothetical protein
MASLPSVQIVIVKINLDLTAPESSLCYHISQPTVLNIQKSDHVNVLFLLFMLVHKLYTDI